MRGGGISLNQGEPLHLDPLFYNGHSFLTAVNNTTDTPFFLPPILSGLCENYRFGEVLFRFEGRLSGGRGVSLGLSVQALERGTEQDVSDL